MYQTRENMSQLSIALEYFRVLGGLVVTPLGPPRVVPLFEAWNETLNIVSEHGVKLSN